MIKERINSNKGITLVSLVMTIVLLLILTGTGIYSINVSNNGSYYYNKMVADINLLNDKVLVYYNKYNEIPKTNRVWERNINQVGNVKYYEIDLSKLEGVTLNYGNDYGKIEELTENSDVYLINSNLHIYYLRGVKKDGEIYHFISDNENYAPDIEDEEPELPEGCVELEYIESTGTQYIDTGIFPNQNTKVEIDGKQIKTVHSSLFGVNPYFVITSGNGNYRYRYNNTEFNTNISAITRHFLVLDKNNAYIDGILLNTFNVSNFQTEYTAILFGRRASNGNVEEYPGSRIYSCKLYDDGNLIRDFIPCEDPNGVVCLYDKVENKYYYNQGTGDFIGGSESGKRTELEYIESTGRQYIDTGIFPNQNTKVEIDGQQIEIVSSSLFGVNPYFVITSGNGNYRYRYNNTNFDTNISASTRHFLVLDKNNAYIDGILLNTFNVSSFQTEYTAILFGRRASGGNVEEHPGSRIYSCKLYDDGNLIRDFMPCEDPNGVVCLYDKVEDNYYYNQGTGDFIAGPEV